MRTWRLLLALAVGVVWAHSAEAEPVQVLDVPRVGWSMGKDYSPIACLEAALFGMGKFVSYEKLMVASAAAFRTAWRPGHYDFFAKHYYQHDPIVLGAPAAGARAEVITVAGEDAAWNVIKASIDRGAPVISWDDGEGRHQVICGYDPEAHSLLCRSYVYTEDDYVERLPSTAKATVGRGAEYELWLLHDEGTEPPPELDWPVVLARALRMAQWPEDQRLHRRYVCGLAAYQAWIATLRSPEAHKGYPEAGLLTLGTALGISEARSAAASILEQNAHVHEAFKEAGLAYLQEAHKLSEMDWTLSGGQQLPWDERREAFEENMKDAAVREEAATLIEEALEHEQSALAALERALGELNPELMP